MRLVKFVADLHGKSRDNALCGSTGSRNGHTFFLELVTLDTDTG